MDILSRIKNEKDYLVKIRRELHQFPEASLEEFETASRIERELLSMGIEHRRVGETGILGIIRGEKQSGKIIVLRADIDALRITDEKEEEYCSQNKGIMHACGHDSHVASLLGAAKVLQNNRSMFGGEIRLFFQQAEEIGQGARIFVKEGLLEGAERAFGIHVSSNLSVGCVALYNGPSNASCDYFKITVNGKAAHVSTPHEGVDAVYIASQIVVALQAIISRQSDPMDTIVIGIGKMTAGTAYNIVAKTAMLEGTTRCLTQEVRDATNKKIIETVTTISGLYGGSADIQWENYANPLINDTVVSNEIRALVKENLGEDRLVSRPLSLGADDFADLLQVVPGTYAFVGSANKDLPNTNLPHHNEKFDIDEDCMLTSAYLYAAYAVKYLK